MNKIRTRKFETSELINEIETIIKEYKSNVKNIPNGQDILYAIWNKFDFKDKDSKISDDILKIFISSLSICPKKKSCKCTYCYVDYYMKQKNDILCKKPKRKGTKNNCFCLACNTKRIKLLILFHKIMKNPFAVYEIPQKLAKILFNFLVERNILIGKNFEDHKKIGKFYRMAHMASSSFLYTGEPNYKKDVGIKITDREFVEKYKDEYDLEIYDDYLIPKEWIEIEKAVANFIETQTTTFYPQSYEEIEAEIKQYCKEQEIESNLDLIQSVGTALISPISLIIGAAGTGKTKSIEVIYYLLKKNSISCHGAAFTGKAVDKLKSRFNEKKDILDNTDVMPLSTIHTFIYNTDRQMPKVLIIDEASMLSTRLAFELFNVFIKTGNKVQLIFVGDNNQLPPIDCGRFFLSLQKSIVPKSELTINFRTRSEYGVIIENSREYLSSSKTVNVDLSHPNIFRIEKIDNLTKMKSHLLRLYFDRGFLSTDKLKRNQVICPSVKSCLLINSIVQNEMIPKKQKCVRYRYKGESYQWYIGDKVICLKNDHVRISNGSDGIIKRFELSNIYIFPRKGGYKYMISTYNNEYSNKLEYINPKKGRSIPVLTVVIETSFGEYDFPILYCEGVERNLRIKDLDLAYAITTHKSQGNEYDETLYFLNSYLPPSKSNIYTAITRSKKKFTVVEYEDIISDFYIFKNPSSDGETGDILHTLIQSIPVDKTNGFCTVETFNLCLRKTKYKKLEDFQLSKTKINIECSKGHIIQLSPYSFSVMGVRCKYCSKTASKMEIETVEICKKRGWKYISEYPCESMNGRRYDFLIQDGDTEMFVELDGEQHFKYVPHFHKTESRFKIEKMIDVLKTYHAIKSSKPILRIDYHYNIEKALESAFQFFINRNKSKTILESFKNNLLVTDVNVYKDMNELLIQYIQNR